ncbi:hypothetical protein KL86CLO1_11860 [uncultured Eubacteriales bacterium]|uniref:Uncharacterized protein n=1 Tax=uncultured Eubacteriales bacterium TaxID=172733 RepID=A0A212JXH3_9FIRM|nr:hypothetical protein KL86CLO1_11860 [uncultured Eubacteriales bacterium]
MSAVVPRKFRQFGLQVWAEELSGNIGLSGKDIQLPFSHALLQLVVATICSGRTKYCLLQFSQ